MDNANEQAFPLITENETYTRHAGLTKREYFVAMAMQGILAANMKIEYGDFGKMRDIGDFEVADYAIQMADLILKKLDQ